MLFLNSQKLLKKQNLKLEQQQIRKEKDSFLVNTVTSKTSIITSKYKSGVSPKLCSKRASPCISGSITVEASLAIPIFFIALICIIYLMEMMAMQMCIRIGMHSALDIIVGNTTTISYMSTSAIEDVIVEAIGSEKLEQSIVINGSEGLDCSGSQISLVTGLITLRVSYSMELPFIQFGTLGLTYEEEMIAKGWTGYESSVSIDSEEIVYITDTSSVYHVSSQCTHLVLDISTVMANDLTSLRNEYGGTYSACSKCVSEDESDLLNGNESIYIASTGNHYHSSLSCSGLTRTVYSVSISEVIGMGVCSRCGT